MLYATKKSIVLCHTSQGQDPIHRELEFLARETSRYREWVGLETQQVVVFPKKTMLRKRTLISIQKGIVIVRSYK